MTLEVPASAIIDEWRQKAIAGTLTDEEMIAAIRAIRSGRVSASQASAKSRAAKAASAPIDAAGLLEELDSL